MTLYQFNALPDEQLALVYAEGSYVATSRAKKGEECNQRALTLWSFLGA